MDIQELKGWQAPEEHPMSIQEALWVFKRRGGREERKVCMCDTERQRENREHIKFRERCGMGRRNIREKMGLKHIVYL